MIRPEIRAFAARWHEMLIGAALVLVGARWGLWGYGLAPFLGGVVVVLGGLGMALGWQRGRFRASGSGGRGVVSLEEGLLLYLAPDGGDAVALSDLTRITLHPAPAPSGTRFWRLESATVRLDIPVNAEGVEALFDCFTRLPGLAISHALTALEHPLTHPVQIWPAPAQPRPRHPIAP